MAKKESSQFYNCSTILLGNLSLRSKIDELTPLFGAGAGASSPHLKSREPKRNDIYNQYKLYNENDRSLI